MFRLDIKSLVTRNWEDNSKKKRPKSDNFYGSLYTMREAEDRVRERREREYYSSLVQSPEPGRAIDSKKAQRLINQGRVSLTYPSDNSKGSPLSKLSSASTRTPSQPSSQYPPKTPPSPGERLKALLEVPGSDFLSLPLSASESRLPMATFTLA